jgi:hypothetical protein
MTDDDPNAPSNSTSSSRRTRQGVGGSPVGSTVSIVLAVIAVIVGFLILNDITSDDDGDSAAVATVPDTATVTTAASAVTTTTEPQLVTEGATVIVANASGIGGSAGQMTEQLAAVGFETGPPTNATTGSIEDSLVYYDPGIAAAEAVAESVAFVMGGLEVDTVPEPPPVEGQTLDGAGVLVMLGTNEAGRTLEELAPDAQTTVTAPPVAGGTATTTATTTPTTETTTG